MFNILISELFRKILLNKIQTLNILNILMTRNEFKRISWKFIKLLKLYTNIPPPHDSHQIISNSNHFPPESNPNRSNLTRSIPTWIKFHPISPTRVNSYSINSHQSRSSLCKDLFCTASFSYGFLFSTKRQF